MKKTCRILSVALCLCASLLSSCSFDKKGTATIYDGETQWRKWDYQFVIGEINEGDLAAWAVSFVTEIGNSYRTLSLIMFTGERGVYSGIFDPNTKKWSNNAINSIRLTVDYDGQPYPAWVGKSAIVTIHDYNKETKAMSATLEAVVEKEGTSETRTVKVEMDNLHFVSR